MWLFLAFLTVPLIEIGLFITVGEAIGLWPTLGIVILTAVIGTALVRSQGAMALNNLRGSFNQLNDPTEHLAHGAMIIFSGALHDHFLRRFATNTRFLHRCRGFCAASAACQVFHFPRAAQAHQGSILHVRKPASHTKHSPDGRSDRRDGRNH